jgi:UDP-glucose 4-epimerase
MNVIVTGGSGFIGTHLLKHLSLYGDEILNLDIKDSCVYAENITHTYCDIRNQHEIYTSIKNWIESKNIRSVYLIHLAALVSVIKSSESPKEDVETNLIGTINVINALKGINVTIGKVLFSSTCAVYGEHSTIIKEFDSTNPISPYGISKLAAEKYFGISKLPYIIFRFGNVYGPGQEKSSELSAIPLFIKNIRAGVDSEIYGYCTRDYIYVEDIVRGLIAGLTSEFSNTIYNLGTGKTTTTDTLYNLIESVLRAKDGVDSPSKGLMRKPRPVDIISVRLAIHKAVDELGWKPTIGLKDGLSRTV